MRNIVTLIVLFISLAASSQVLGLDVLNFGAKTTAEMNAISASKIQVGSYLDNSDTETLWRYNGSIWVDQGSNSYDDTAIQAEVDLNTAKETNTDIQDLSLSGNIVSISNGTDVDLTPILSDTQLTDAQVATAVNSEFPNLDTDVTDDFSGDFTALTNIPSGLADGDDNTDEQTAIQVPFTPYFTLNQTDVQSAMQWIWGQKYDDVTIAANGNLEFNANGVNRLTIGKSSFDNQSVSLDGNTLNITNGTGVDLSPILNTSALTVAQTTQLTNAAKDFIATTYASDKTLIPSDRFIEATGFDIGRKRIVQTTTEVTFTLDNSYANDDIQRFKTLGSGVINIIPDTGVTIAYTGKTTLTGVSMTGVGTLGYLYKESSNNYRFYCETITGYSPPSTNLFAQANISNPDNYSAATFGSWTDGGSGTFGLSEITDDPGLNCLTSIRYSRNQTSGTLFRRTQFADFSGAITGYDAANTYEVSFWMKSSNASHAVRLDIGNQDVLTSSSGTVSGDDITLTVPDTGWNEYTFQFSGNGSAVNFWIYGAYNQSVEFFTDFTEITITQQ
jgi:hypothetical protein